MKITSQEVYISPGLKTKKRFGIHMREFIKQGDLQIMVIPWILWLVVFSYAPMYGLIMAFQEYNLGDIPGFSQWVGFQHFLTFFQAPEFTLIIRNTFVISILRLLIGFPLPIILAIMLNEVQGLNFKKTIQTISYLPHFISWVVVASLTFDMLSVDGGMVNYILQQVGLIKEPIMFMGEPKYFWAIVVITDLWKEVGWGAIIYIASIAGIDQELYQAAEIDGAGRFSKIWHITLSGIKPTIVILLILSVGNILNAGFEQILLLTNNLHNTMVSDVSEIIDTYVYRLGIQQFRLSYATAAGIFKAVINMVFLIAANMASRKINDESLW